MKKLILSIAFVSLLFSCSKENQELTQEEQNLIAATENFTDVKTMLPNASNDLTSNGIYTGIITADETRIHGKLFINVGNDGTYRALVETTNNQSLKFVSVPALNSSKPTSYVFTGDRGSFTLNLSDFENPVISNVIIDNTAGNALAVKNTSTRSIQAVLGTFNHAATGTVGFMGTFDFMYNVATDFITQVTVTTSAGVMSTDLAVNFENGQSCYGVNKPFFFQDPAFNQYELMATGQSWVLPNGLRLFYDFGFSKQVQDLNGIPYTNGVYFPTATNSVYFNPPLDPAVSTCRNINANGLYYVRNQANTAFVSAGQIVFDTSALVVVPPPPPAVNSAMSNNNAPGAVVNATFNGNFSN